MDLKPTGVLLVDSTFVNKIPIPRAYQIPFTRIARDRFKKEMVANIIALGAISWLTPIVSVKAIEAAVLARVPRGTENLNRNALRAGISAAKKVEKTTLLTPSNFLENEDT